MLPRFPLNPSLTGLQLTQHWIEMGLVAGLAGNLGVRPVAARLGFVRFECIIDEDHANFVGLVHGGLSAALVDIAGGAAAMTLLQPGETLLTTDLHIRYLRPAPISTKNFSAEATSVYHDERRIIGDVRILSDTTLVAHGSVSIAIRAAKRL